MSYSRLLALIVAISSGMFLLHVQPSQAAPGTDERGANTSPFGVVVLADLAQVGGTKLVLGSTLYAGDSLQTEDGGSLRLTLGGGQVYLLSSSAADLLRSGPVFQASITRGTVGFSALTDKQFQIVTPEGIVEAANGLPAFGQVTFAGKYDIVISAYTGALVLHRGNQTLMVKAGQSYYVSLVPDDDSRRRGGTGYDYHLEWRLIVVGAAAGVGYFLWRLYSTSPVVP
ncbi:MAG: hypothetical protein ACRD8A_16630 [Candidatus Acidiferrales bacterium]